VENLFDLQAVSKCNTIFKDCLNSSIRNVVKKGLTAEFRKRNNSDFSLKAKSHVCLRYSWYLYSRTLAMKYGIRERIRDSKMRKEVMANFPPFVRFSAVSKSEVLYWQPVLFSVSASPLEIVSLKANASLNMLIKLL